MRDFSDVGWNCKPVVAYTSSYAILRGYAEGFLREEEVTLSLEPAQKEIDLEPVELRWSHASSSRYVVNVYFKGTRRQMRYYALMLPFLTSSSLRRKTIEDLHSPKSAGKKAFALFIPLLKTIQRITHVIANLGSTL